MGETWYDVSADVAGRGVVITRRYARDVEPAAIAEAVANELSQRYGAAVEPEAIRVEPALQADAWFPSR